ncbi:Hypothetical predicted protein [Paramuricea clavata]|uniref:Uncharacterized protein n=1 Tax=Paramuricea clavata TaxID=317549 RepID=A0A7D9HXU1_PARCT|nr:Hypothetical predicted protein [Paramuricea clavata]
MIDNEEAATTSSDILDVNTDEPDITTAGSPAISMLPMEQETMKNEVGSSMEYAGFCKSMEYLLGLGLVVKTFVSDRHSAIAKHMRENHVVDKHENLDNPVFNKCGHKDIIQPRNWLDKDSIACEKTCSTLTNKRLKKGIMKASPVEQTSCLEGFYFVLNQFSPKMIGYSYRGMFCRHVIAIIHFNKNLSREKRTKDGIEQYNVIYPKFMNGEAVVRKGFSEAKLCHRKKQLKRGRDTMQLVDIPPTNPVPTITTSNSVPSKPRNVPKCRMCKQPMKGYKNVSNCPRNKKD